MRLIDFLWVLVLGLVIVGLMAGTWGRSLMLVAADVSRNREAIVTVNGPVLEVSGRLTDSTMQTLDEVDLSPIRTLRINSSGGVEDTAISLAERVALNQWDLIVEQECSGACGLYVFPAATTKTIQPGAFVACGASVFASTAVPDSAFGRDLTNEERSTVERAQRLFESLGVSESYALSCLAGLIPTCYGLKRERDTLRRAAHLSRRLWIPSVRTFAEFGIGNVRGAPSRTSDVENVRYLQTLRWDWAVGEGNDGEFLRREFARFATQCLDQDRDLMEAI